MYGTAYTVKNDHIVRICMNIKKYVMLSLETHLFFVRIMKEHALFLLAGFPAHETEFRNRADWFRIQFEMILETTVRLADGAVRESVLHSGEVVTEFTEMAERQTSCLTGIPVDVKITQAEERLSAGFQGTQNWQMVQQVRRLNQTVLQLLNGLIVFKEKLLQEMDSCRLYTSNYPLLIEHILREAKMYRQIVFQLEGKGNILTDDLKQTELFWNQIMMEHAQFIRGLLDPTECELMNTADEFAGAYCRLLEEARNQDCLAMDELTRQSLETTEKYQEFKTAGTRGITACEIRSLILPLLADHVLREANHYLRILKGRE